MSTRVAGILEKYQAKGLVEYTSGGELDKALADTEQSLKDHPIEGLNCWKF